MEMREKMTTISTPPSPNATRSSRLERRPRRLRGSSAVRAMVRETQLAADDLIMPLFVVPESRPRVEISSMPGIFQNRVSEAVAEAKACWDAGVQSVLLFGIPAEKDAIGSSSWDANGPVQSAIRAIRDAVPEMAVLADVCLCEYTDHGHCGVVSANGEVRNDETLELLARQAVSFAEAGAHFVAPSDMMDGRVGAIRRALDARGFENTGVIAYSAKYASGFYGPFREAAESAPKFGDRRTYQMDPSNSREAMREIELDVEEGADMIMVKPALSYLDVIRMARDRFDLPVVAYNVSGEYAMVKAAARNGWIDEARVTDEILTSIKRAGADLIITYHALEWAERNRR